MFTTIDRTKTIKIAFSVLIVILFTPSFLFYFDTIFLPFYNIKQFSYFYTVIAYLIFMLSIIGCPTIYIFLIWKLPLIISGERYKKLILYFIFFLIHFFSIYLVIIGFLDLGEYYQILDFYGEWKHLVHHLFLAWLYIDTVLAFWGSSMGIELLVDNIIRNNRPLKLNNWIILISISIVITIFLFINREHILSP